MNKLEKIISENQKGVVLFLGRVTNFTAEELGNFLEAQGMSYAEKYTGQEVALLVLSSMMTPLEEDLSYELYDLNVPDVSLQAFESFYTTHIKPNTLLMSLKLSNDQERLIRLLKNEAFADDVYLKLFNMYDWRGEGIHETDNNRDITISFVTRFYKPDGFRDPAMIYAPTTVMNIAQETANSDVLDAILSMPNHQIKVSRFEQHRPRNLRETVAFNESISQLNIKRLMGYHDTSLDYFLAANSALASAEQEILYARATEETMLMLAHNENLSDELFEKLLSQSDNVVKTLFTYQPMSELRVLLLSEHHHLAYVGKNQTITSVIAQLLAFNDETLDREIASNSTIASDILLKLYDKYGESIGNSLAQNENLPTRLFHEFYARNNREIIEFLATNRATPKEILSELCELKERELNRLLASNPSVDIYYLREFQLDTSLIRILADNETYGKSVLQGLGL